MISFKARKRCMKVTLTLTTLDWEAFACRPRGVVRLVQLVFPSQPIGAYWPRKELQIKPLRQKDRSQMFVCVLNLPYDCKIQCKLCSGLARLRSAGLTLEVPLILPPGSGLQDAWIYQPLSYQELLFEKYFCGPFFPNCLSKSTEAPCVSSEQNHDRRSRVKPAPFRLDWSFKTCRRNTATCSNERWRLYMEGIKSTAELFYYVTLQSVSQLRLKTTWVKHE